MKRKGSDIRSFFGTAAKKSRESSTTEATAPAAQEQVPGDTDLSGRSAVAESEPTVTQQESQERGNETEPTSPTSERYNISSGSLPSAPENPTAASSCSSRLDIADYVAYQATVTDDVKLKLIQSRKPGSSDEMPCQVVRDKSRKDGVRARYCNRSWFDQFPFTAYSSSKRGIFCLPCVLFPVTQSTSGRARLLITSPLVNWKDAVHDLGVHRSLEYHLSSEARMDAFVRTAEKPASRIDMSLSQEASKTMQDNRAKLISIVKCLEFCARNGMALRGHRDDGDPLDEAWSAAAQGKFKALLNFRVDAGDDMLRMHLESASRRETYVSKTSQNELLACMGDYIRQHITKEVQESHFYAVSADEVTDVSNWEQLGIVLRYIKDGEALERLIGFIALEKVRGCDIFKAIKDFLGEHGVDLKLCCAQAYDGAGAMAGEQRGCQALFREEVPEATYFHCSSHQLNLALSKACGVPEIQRMVATLKQLGIFFKYSPKRQRTLEQASEKVNEELKTAHKPELPKAKFKLLCETRWVERHTALEDFFDLMEPLSRTLETISQPALHGDTTWDSKSMTEACGLLRDLRSPEFLVAFHVCRYFFGFTKDISKLLQGSSMDVLTAYGAIEEAADCIKAARLDCEERFRAIFRTSTLSGEKIGAGELSVPRRCSAQRHRSNMPAMSAEEYWRRSVYVPFADSMSVELSARFNQLSKTAVSGMSLLPLNAVLPDGLSEEVMERLQTTHATDLPSPSTLPQEIERWVCKWKKASHLPTSLTETLAAVDALVFPNIVCLLQLLLIAPVTSASVERANSALKYVKTDLRSTMGQARLNDLILLFVHKDIQLDYQKVVDMFAARAPRRMLLADPCNAVGDEHY